MEYLVSCVAFTLLFLAHIIPSEAVDDLKINLARSEINAIYDYDTFKFFDYKSKLELRCNVSLEPNSTKYTLEWLREDKLVSEDPVIKDRYKASDNKFVIERALESDAGNYTCRVASVPELKADIHVITKPSTKLPPNTSVVEGETLKITCQAYGNPKPLIEWRIGNETYKESKGRVTLKEDNGFDNAILTLADVTLDDRGDFVCRAVNIASNYVNTTDGSTLVRVKDKLAALWPFLGICAEVFVLCAIILIYEKRRNKPDMEESDTDQSPDQKQTPDHGKDVRHRK